jgi:hypothetical protein
MISVIIAAACMIATVGLHGVGFNMVSSNVVIINCVVKNETIAFNGTGNELYIKKSIAENSTTGFLLSGTTSFILSCKAIRNTGIGFDINTAGNLVLGNFAQGNGTNYGGTVGVNASTLALTVSAISNANKWMNIGF